MGNHLDLALASLGDGDGVAEVACAALHLDTVVQEFLKRRDVEDLVAHRLRAVDRVLGKLAWFPEQRNISHLLRHFDRLSFGAFAASGLIIPKVPS